MDQQFLWAKPRNRQQQLTRNIKCVKVLQLTTFSFDSNNLRDCFQTKPFFFNYANCAVQHGPALALCPLSLTLTFFWFELNPELREKKRFCQFSKLFWQGCDMCSVDLFRPVETNFCIVMDMDMNDDSQARSTAVGRKSCMQLWCTFRNTVMETNIARWCSLWIFSVS